MLQPRFPVVAALALAFCAALPAPAGAAQPEEVDAAVKKAVAWLYKAQKPDGTWEEVPQPQPAEKGGGFVNADVKGGQWGGLTAIATYALLASGEKPQDPRLQKAIQFLLQAEILGCYAIGLRSQIYQFLPVQTPGLREAVIRDGNYYLKSMKTGAKGLGMYNYRPDAGDRYDHSVSQYGVLGIWAIAEMGFEVPDKYWQTVDQQWRKHQYDDGAWSYVFSAEDDHGKARTASMTAAGVATLFITQDYLFRNAGIECNGNIFNENIEAGLHWFSQDFNKKVFSGSVHYTLYGIERIGVASGYKYFGTVDWYQSGAEYLVRHQNPGGDWGGIPNTCFGTLFLVRGRAPVMMNKLDYSPDPGQAPVRGKAPTITSWNQRPRDAANLARFASKSTERFLNWQIVNLRAPVEDLHDAPILYIAGSHPLNFTKAEQDKLRLFIEQGGLVLGHADCNSKKFADSFRTLGVTLFPSYEFRPVPNTHPIYTSQQFKPSAWRKPPQLMGLSNGSRELMLLLPQGDPARFWQAMVVGGSPENHELPTNVFLYAIDRQNLRTKGQTYMVTATTKLKGEKKLSVARLEYTGNWNPEPAGWRRLAAFMFNQFAAELTVEPVKLGTAALTGTYQAAHLTGTAAVKLPQAAKDELKKYIEGGGTLIVDAAGGSPEFGTSLRSELEKIGGGEFKTIKVDDPLYTAGGRSIADPGYRSYTVKQIGRPRGPRILGLQVGGRTAIYFSGEDLSTGLVGQPVDGIVGYDPESASEMMSAMLLEAGKMRLKPEDRKRIADAVKGTAPQFPTPATPTTPAVKPATQPK